MSGTAWFDEDGNLWCSHDCVDGKEEFEMPPPWHVEGDTVQPSLNCTRCGFHEFLKIEQRRKEGEE